MGMEIRRDGHCCVSRSVPSPPPPMCLRERALKEKAMAAAPEDGSWCSLPDDLLENILSRLPLSCKLRCRCACRAWNSLLSSSDRLLHHSTNASSSPSSSSSSACSPSFLLATKGPSICILDPPSNSWRAIPQPAISSGTDTILAAAGSLVCIGNQVSECRFLRVCNLLSGVSQPLPKMLKVGLLHKVSMAVDEHTNAYMILVAGEDSSDFRGRHSYRLLTEVYDSVEGIWKSADDALPEAKFGSDPGVWWNGLYYCITEMPYGLIAYSVSKGSWVDVKVEMPAGLSSPSLVSCAGMLLMVGIVQVSSRYSDGGTINQASLEEPLGAKLPPGRVQGMGCHHSYVKYAGPIISATHNVNMSISPLSSGGIGFEADQRINGSLSFCDGIYTYNSSGNAVHRYMFGIGDVGCGMDTSRSATSFPKVERLSMDTYKGVPPSPGLSKNAVSNVGRPLGLAVKLWHEGDGFGTCKSTKLSAKGASPSSTSRVVCVWSLRPTEQEWQLVDQIPDNLGAEFLSYLMPKTPLICAGAGDRVCVTSHLSRRPLIYNVASRTWVWAASDPLFPKNRDPHLLGFSCQPPHSKQ